METRNLKCIKCGKELTKMQVRHKCKYCSRECYTNSRMGKARVTKELLTKRDTFNDAVKLYQSGKTKTQTAQILGLNPQTISKWFSIHGVENLNDRVCEFCGKSLSGIILRSTRKYCSGRCTSNAAYARKHPGKRKDERYLELRSKGLNLYWDGLGSKAIRKHLGISQNTMSNWIRDYGHLRERVPNPEAFTFMPIAAQLKCAKTAAVWQRILYENAPEGDMNSVRLVCGFFDGKGEIDHFAAIVSDLLKSDPCNGDVYAFCNRKRVCISTICWKQGTFCLVKLPKACGAYIWPTEAIGQQIKVQQNEFEYLLGLQKIDGKMLRYA